MPIPLQTIISTVEPNTLKYDLSIASRIENGELLVSIGVALAPCRCDIVDGVEVYSHTVTTDFPKGFASSNLMQYASDNPDIAPLIAAAWTALSAVVHAINVKDKIL